MTTWEQDMIRQVQAGNRNAYGRLVEKYQGPICHSVSRILGDQEAALEVTQDAFVAAWQHIDAFDPALSFYSWLFRIARNGAINRSLKDRRQRPLADNALRDRDPTPEERLVARESAAEVFRAVKRLPPRYMVPLVLRVYLDFNTGEISEILDLPRATVRSRMRTARGLLAMTLAPEPIVRTRCARTPGTPRRRPAARAGLTPP